jgi:hypothetical protein
LVGLIENEGSKEYVADSMLQIRRDRMTVSAVTDKNGYGTLGYVKLSY